MPLSFDDASFWLARGVGLVALCIGLRANLRRSDASMKRNMSIASALWGVYYLLLGGYTAAATSLISMSRQLVTSRLDLLNARVQRRVEFGYYGAAMVICALTWHGWVSLLPAVATMVSTFAMFRLKFERFRWAMVVSGVIWCANAFYFQAWEQLISVSMSIGTILIGLRGVRLHRLRQERSERDKLRREGAVSA